MTKTQSPMKRIKCPNCGMTLGVPGKVFGKTFDCPKCNTSIDSDQESIVLEDQLPFPDFLPPPGKKPENRPEPKPAPKLELRPVPVPEPGQFKNRESLPEPTPAKPEPVAASPKTTSPAAVARIIRADSVETSLAKHGELPTLQLKDGRQAKLNVSDVRKTPVFLAILISSSILSSALIFLFASQQSVTSQAELDQARAEIAMYYHTRIDVDLKPYQLELREAQLAHSRGDRKSEIDAYRKVMKRFHREDRNQFVGVTGSPTADQELERLVSTMLRGR